MLISDWVKIKWHSNYKDWYINKGYIFTKFKDEFLVKVEDLHSISNAYILVKCDYCENIKDKKYVNYLKEITMIVKKNCCLKCSVLKKQEINLINIGKKSSRTKDYDYIYKQFQLRNCTLLTKVYIDQNQDLEFICNNHIKKGIQKTKWVYFQNVKNCKYCTREYSSESQRNSFLYVKKIFEIHDYILLEDDYINAHIKMSYICKKHPKYIQEIDFHHLHNHNKGCKYCGIEKCVKTKKEKGLKYSKASGWKGGLTSLVRHFRSKITKWKKDSMKYCNYKCVITGKRFDDVHHLYSFYNILKEAITILNLSIYKNLGNYTDINLQQIEQNCIELHYKYPLGVCLTRQLHSLFHGLFGIHNNTPEQFEGFKKNLHFILQY